MCSGNNKGYIFDKWECDDDSVGANDVDTKNIAFTMPDRDIKLSALWTADPTGGEDLPGELYKMTVEGTTTRGTQPGDYQYKENDYVFVTRGIDRTGWHFTGWLFENTDGGRAVEASKLNELVEAGKGKSGYQFQMPNGDITVRPEWVGNEYNLKLINVNGSEEVVSVQRFMTEFTINAGTAAGKTFVRWKLVSGPTPRLFEGNEEHSQMNITIGAGDTILEVVWADNSYAVTVEGSVAEVTGAGQYAMGQKVSVDAGTKAGYNFDRWESTPDIDFIDSSES